MSRSDRITLAIAGLLSIAAASSACLTRCPTPPKVVLSDGVYTPGGRWGGAPFPHAGVEPEITVDRDAGAVTVTYEREDGSKVVEHWKVTSTSWALD